MNQVTQPSYAMLTPGDPFPWVPLRNAPQVTFGFHTLGGRYLVFCFYGSAEDPVGRSAVAAVQSHRELFDDDHVCFFGISQDPSDQELGRVRDILPGLRFMFDKGGEIGRTCGALPKATETQDAPGELRPFWLIVDPTLHVLANIPIGSEPHHHEAVFDRIKALPAPRAFAGFEMPIPVLVLPNVFDQALCRHLVGLYDRNGGSESGIYRNGAGVNDHSFKRRKDFTIEDQTVIRHLQGLIARRVSPEIERLFFTKITRMERYIIGCYAAEDGAHFRPHRDNGPGLTAHRRYAISVNLSSDFDGGDVSFPEYSSRGIKAPQGWAVVFPAAILHSVSKVTYGRRYAFLPFVYDESGAVIRERELSTYHAAQAPPG